MKKVRNLRYYILGLVGLGTIVNYIDRNTFGILAISIRAKGPAVQAW